jgi:hypothetical protein
VDQGHAGQGQSLNPIARRTVEVSGRFRTPAPLRRAGLSLPLLAGLLCGGRAVAGVPDAGLSTATSQPGTVYASPGAGGRPLLEAGCVVTVTIRDGHGQPIAGYPFQDLWLDSASPGDLGFCAGGSVADADTDGAGRTTFSGSLRGGGFTQGGLRALVSGVPISGSPVLPIQVNSPDITGDLRVDLGDVGPFSSNLNGTYNFRSDFFRDGVINLADVGIFSGHLGAGCP